MTDKFKSPCPLPTPYEREVLTILIEEAAEVQQRATKMIRFGVEEVQQGQNLSNKDRLSQEIGDLNCMINMAAELGLVDIQIAKMNEQKKKAKNKKYMQECY